MSFRAVLLAAFLLAASVTPALAQSNPPSASTASDLEQRVAMARRYMAAVQIEKMMKGVAESTYGQQFDQADIPEDKREFLRGVLEEAYAAVMPELIEMTVNLYAESFSLVELTEVVAFYESPVGRSLVAKSVMLTRRTDELYAAIMPRMEEEILRRICGDGGCDTDASTTSGKRP